MPHTCYLTKYLNQLTPQEQLKPRSVNSGYFCADEYNANLCADLVLRGIKTATCSLHYWYEQGESLPQVGDLHIVTNWQGYPLCIIEINEVKLCPFNQVTANFAYCEGEGDRSLNDWHKMHQAFFEQECREAKITFTEDSLLVLEHFKVVYT